MIFKRITHLKLKTEVSSETEYIVIVNYIGCSSVGLVNQYRLINTGGGIRMALFCAKCGKKLSDGPIYCYACVNKAEEYERVNGKPLINPQFINQDSVCGCCGTNLDLTAIYCSTCVPGSQEIPVEAVKVNAGNNEQNQTPNQEGAVEPEKRDVMFYAKWILLAGLIVFIYIFLTNSTPEKTVQKFVKAYNNNNAEDMLSCMDPGTQQYFTGILSLLAGTNGYDVFGMFEEVIGHFSDYSGSLEPAVDHIEVIDVKYDTDSHAIVHVKWSYSAGDGSFYEEDYIDMIKIENKWYITLFQDLYGI